MGQKMVKVYICKKMESDMMGIGETANITDMAGVSISMGMCILGSGTKVFNMVKLL